MSEVSANAAVFLATSHQARKRAILYDTCGELGLGLRFCNSMVCLIFACFYLEETLSVIIEQSGNEKNFKDFIGKRKPSLLNRITWFYNFFISEDKYDTYNDFIDKYDYENRLDILDNQFEDFKKLHSFRNNLVHANEYADVVNDFELILNLRQSSKEIVTKLLLISKLTDFQNVKYNQAVEQLTNSNQDGS